MKKLLAIALSLLMVVGVLAGCGAKDTAPAPAETKAPAAEAPATEAAQQSYMDELIAMSQMTRNNFSYQVGLSLDINSMLK